MQSQFSVTKLCYLLPLDGTEPYHMKTEATHIFSIKLQLNNRHPHASGSVLYSIAFHNLGHDPRPNGKIAILNGLPHLQQ